MTNTRPNLPLQELELAVVRQVAVNFLRTSAPMVTAQTPTTSTF